MHTLIIRIVCTNQRHTPMELYYNNYTIHRQPTNYDLLIFTFQDRYLVLFFAVVIDFLKCIIPELMTRTLLTVCTILLRNV